MKLILHPGNAKCGSTSIQDFIKLKYKDFELLGYGIINRNLQIYTENDQDIKQATNVSLYFKNIYSIADFEDKFKHDLKALIESCKKKYKVLIMSGEFLSGDIERTQSIHKVLKNTFDEIKVTFFMRRQDDLYLSLWQQSLFYKGISISEAISSQELSKSCDLEKKTTFLETLYGRENLMIKPVYKGMFENTGPVGAFLQLNGISMEAENINSNRSLNPMICEIFALTGIKLQNKAQFLRGMKLIGKCSAYLYQNNEDFLNADTRNSIPRKYHNYNRHLQQNYFPEIPFDKVFAPISANKKAIEISNNFNLFKQEMAFQLAAIWNLTEKIEHIVKKANKKNWKNRLKSVLDRFGTKK